MDEFFKSVRIHCDKALSPHSETCRTRRYLIDLNQMKAISRELKKREIRKCLQKATEVRYHPKPYEQDLTASPVHSSLGGSAEARLRGLQPLRYASAEYGGIPDSFTTSPSLRSLVTSVLASSCPPTPLSTTFRGAGQQRPCRNSAPTMSVVESTLAIPKSQPHGFEQNTPPKIGARCDICNYPFTGNKSDCRTNLNRHKRNIHNSSPKIPCLFKDCLVEFSRSDARLKHWEKKHGFDGRGRAKKRKRT